MILSIRIDQDLEKEVNRAAKITGLKRSDIIRKSLSKFLGEITGSKKISPFHIYQTLEKEIPGSRHGTLSINHRQEVLKILKKRRHHDTD